MPVINRIAGFADEMTAWRRHIHMNPEIGFDCFKTADFVSERLREFGVDEIHGGIAKTGIVAIINGQGKGPTIGLRADMDALPMSETTGLDHASTVSGCMHACGHDGHTAMLLGAAKYLAETRAFKGRVALIFQPAEEGPGGGRVMVEEGIMDRFDISQVFALHTEPGTAEGTFVTRTGPMLAAADTFRIYVSGKGGHAAYPDECANPIPATLSIAQALSTIVSGNRSGLDDLIVTTTQIHAGTTDNVIPDDTMLEGTVRTFRKEVQEMVVTRMKEIVDGQARAFGVTATLDFSYGYPVTSNDPAKVDFATETAKEVSGLFNADGPREMGAEDFSYMLNERPGAFLYIGQGDAAPLHNPNFDFNDKVAPIGASFFARLVERAQPL